MTHYTRADLETAERHVAQGEQHVARQEELLTVMRTRAQPTESAEALLTLFNSTLVEHRAHRDAIAKALDARGQQQPRGDTL